MKRSGTFSTRPQTTTDSGLTISHCPDELGHFIQLDGIGTFLGRNDPSVRLFYPSVKQHRVDHLAGWSESRGSSEHGARSDHGVAKFARVRNRGGRAQACVELSRRGNWGKWARRLDFCAKICATCPRSSVHGLTAGYLSDFSIKGGRISGGRNISVFSPHPRTLRRPYDRIPTTPPSST